jgi:hypothetical protein
VVADHVRKLNSFTEISPSGQGIHVFLKGKLPENGRKKGDYEIYQANRYMTVTGHVLEGFPRTLEPRQIEVTAFYEEIFGVPGKHLQQEINHQVGRPLDGWRDLLEKAFRSKNGNMIEKLWNGDASDFSSSSEADLSMCSHLAFWFNGDTATIDAAIRESGLYREKWDEKHYGDGRTYGEVTISKAVDGCYSHYGDHSQGGDGIVEITPLHDWPDPIPFNDYSRLPEFPVDAIPGVCGQMVSSLSESCQVDAGLPGCMMLATLSTAIGGKIQVGLVTHSEPGNIYTNAIIGSGNRKSEVVGQLAEPVYLFQRDLQEKLAPVIREAASNYKILEKRLEKSQKEAARTNDPMEREAFIQDCNDVLKEMENNPVPTQQVFLVDDVTPEALGKIMADNGERAAILSAEGGIFRIMAGLYHNGQANIDLFLKGHAGDYWSNNRIGRESQTMLHPTLTLGLAIQPDVIEEIGQNSEFRGRGLSARFLYALCQSKAGYRTRQSVPVHASIKDAYNKGIINLMEHSESIELSLTTEAQAVWDVFYDDVEKRLRPGGELENIIDWGSKLPGAVARIAGLLHFADFADSFPGKHIREETVRSACVIGSYYLKHAKAVFGMMKEDQSITMGKKILNYIKNHKPVKFKGRDLFNHTNCQSMEEVNPGLNILIERGFIREIEKLEKERRKGRPASTTYEVNPKIFSYL